MAFRGHDGIAALIWQRNEGIPSLPYITKPINAVDTMLRCLKERFGGLDQFKFMALLDMTNCGKYTKKFPEKELSELRSLNVKKHIFIPPKSEQCSQARYQHRKGDLRIIEQ